MSDLSNIIDPQIIYDDPEMQNFFGLDLNGFLTDTAMIPSQEIDLNTVKVETVPVAQTVLPNHVISDDDYPGDYDFNVFIDPYHGSKSPWNYSSALNKVFILVNTKFPVEFKWTGNPNVPLFVRAMPLFTSQYQHELVTRCIPHAQGNETSNQGYDATVWQHIIRCHSPSAIYQGDKDSGQHLSVVIPSGQPQAGSDTVRFFYEFVCKNSCPTGMNRRPLEVVFTLENMEGEILGRRTLNVRVCSCPKRDKDKEERDFHKNKNNSGAPPQGKKRKLEKKPSSYTEEQASTKEYHIPINIIGKKNRDLILQVAHSLMANEILRHKKEHPYKKCMLELSQMMNQSE